jgi:tetratricopeptide (TPR) repeat protein
MTKERPVGWSRIFPVGLVLTLVLAGALSAAQAASPAPNPFYVRALESAVRSYQAQDYREAAKSLEIATFGLAEDPTLLGKALGYLSLSYFNLKDDAQAESTLARLIALVGLDKLSGLDMDPQDRTHLVQVVAFYRLDQAAGGTPGPSRTDTLGRSATVSAGGRTASTGDQVKALEARIRVQPKNAQAYLDLYEFQRLHKNPKAARRVLEDLVKKIPTDPTGPFLLGQIRFADKDYKAAAPLFEKVLTLRKEAPPEDKDYLIAQAYLILSYNTLRKTALVEKTCREFLGRTTPDTVLTLDLAQKDKTLVLGLLARYRSASASPATAVPAPAGGDEAGLKNAIKKNPRDASLYYGLYDLYLQKKDRSAARKALESLVKSNPLEAKGFLLLGRLHYQDKNYGKAADALERIFRLPAGTPVEASLRSEAAFYLVLSRYRDKDQKGALEDYNVYRPWLEDYLSGEKVPESESAVWQNLRRTSEASPLVYVLDTRVERTATGLEIKVDLSGPTNYRTFILTRERSLVIELFHVGGSRAPALISVGAHGVKAVRSSMYQKETARVVLEGQTQIPNHRIVKTDTGLSIVIE